MAEDVLAMLGDVMARWMTGAPAAPAAPEWQAELGAEATEAELRLLALCGQFLGAAVASAPTGALRSLPDLPPLALPTVPPTLRPLLRRVLAAQKDVPVRAEVLGFLAGRGWTTHPADWLPTPGDDSVPDIYAPWRDWALGAVPRPADAGLTAENWDDFLPAARKAALAALRRQTPDIALALLADRFGGLDADERLRLLGLLADRLSETDVVFLRGVATTDRAPKVKALAMTLLGRLGHGEAPAEAAAELAGFFELRSKGPLRRSQVITARALKTDAQRAQRRNLFAEVDPGAFAAAVGVDADVLGTNWAWQEDARADLEFVTAVADRGSAALLAAVVSALQGLPKADPAALAALRPRLNDAQRAECATYVLGAGESFAATLVVAGGIGRIAGAMTAPAGAALLTALGGEGANAAPVAAELFALGLIASRPAAIEAVGRLTQVGVLAADPRLDMLRLNAALDGKEEPE